MAAPAYDNSVKVASAANVASLTSASWTIAGSNRYLFAHVGSGAGTPVNPSACKWQGSAGTALTQKGSTIDTASNFKSSAFGLVAPAAVNSTLYASWGSNQDETSLMGESVKDVDQVTPEGTLATATGTNTSSTVSPTTVVDDFVVSGMWFGNTDCSSRTITIATGTSRQETEGATLTCEGAGLADNVAVGASTTCAWTISGSIVGGWAMFALPLKPVSAGLTAAQEMPAIYQQLSYGIIGRVDA